MSEHNRSLYLQYEVSFRHPYDFSMAISEFFAPEANLHVVHPFNSMREQTPIFQSNYPSSAFI